MTGAGETWPGLEWLVSETRLLQQPVQARQGQIPPNGGGLVEDQPQAQELNAGPDGHELRHLHWEEFQSG